MSDLPRPDMAHVWTDYHTRSDRRLRRVTVAVGIILAAALVSMLAVVGMTAHANAMAQAATMGAY